MSISKEAIEKPGRVSMATLSTLMMKDHGLANTGIRGVSMINDDGKRMAGSAYTMRYPRGAKIYCLSNGSTTPKT